MKGKILITVLVMAALALIFSAGCRENKAVDYFPLGEGSFWEYNVLTIAEEEGGLTRMSIEIQKVIGKERVGNRENYVIDRFNIEGQSPSVGQYREYLVKTDKGVECTKRSWPMLEQMRMQMYPGAKSDIVHTPAEERFRNNLKQGDTWKWEGFVTLVPVMEDEDKTPEGATPQLKEVKQIKGSMEYKCLGYETIHVLNKDLNCLKLSLLGKSESGQEIESTIWYADGIGRVREEQKFYEGSKTILYLFELVNYNITNRESFKSK